MDEDNWTPEEEDTTVNPEHELSDDTDEEPQSSVRLKKQITRKIVMNVALTKYSVVKKTAKHFK